MRRSESARRELARKLAAARDDLAKLQAKRSGTSARVAVELSAERGGTLELAVSYLVPGAGWRPVWDARLTPETGAVELALLGEVSQRTGEDWTEAHLALSTAEPGRGSACPSWSPAGWSGSGPCRRHGLRGGPTRRPPWPRRPWSGPGRKAS